MYLRLATLDMLLPSTRQLLTTIYGSREAYAQYNDPEHNPYRVLEEACMLYDQAVLTMSDPFAVAGLRVLDVEYDDTDVRRTSARACAGVCGMSCHYRCLGNCGEWPVAILYDTLKRIANGEVEKYLVNV